MKRLAVAAVATVALAGCASSGPEEPAAPSSTTSTTVGTTAEPDSTKVTVDGLALDRDNWTDRFVLEKKQWLDEVVRVAFDEDDQEFEISTVLERPRDSKIAVEMCEALRAMAEDDGYDTPRIEVLDADDSLMARFGNNPTRDHCIRI